MAQDPGISTYSWSLGRRGRSSRGGAALVSRIRTPQTSSAAAYYYGICPACVISSLLRIVRYHSPHIARGPVILNFFRRRLIRERKTMELPQRPRKRARVACTWCHERKVRCDVSIRGSPCTNCQLDGHQCNLRPTASKG